MDALTQVGSSEDRTQFIGGSDVAAILGFSPWKTRLQVYEEKIGLASGFSGNQHTQRGTKLEAVAADEYEERYGQKLHRINARITHPVYPFLTARIDRRIVGKDGIAEIKCPSLGSFSRIKRLGLGEDYICQMHHYLGLMQKPFGEWVIFCADQWDMIRFPVEIDQQLVNDMTDRLVSFWQNHVVPRVPPPVEEKDEARLEVQRAEGTATLYIVDDDPEFAEAAQLLREAKQLASEAETIETEAKDRIKAVIGDRQGVFTGKGFKISYMQQAGKKSFDQKALAGAKALDRIKVGQVVQRYWDSLSSEPSRLQYSFEQTIKEIGAQDIDLTQYEKRGAPFMVLRPTFFGER